MGKLKIPIKQALLKKDKNNPCDGCAKCCKYIAVEIDKPTCKGDYDNIIWYLLHENVRVYEDHDGDWYVEFITRCKNLDENEWCGDYKNRPKVCRDYSPEECEQYGDGLPWKIMFNDPKKFIGYLEDKGIDWQFNNLEYGRKSPTAKSI